MRTVKMRVTKATRDKSRVVNGKMAAVGDDKNFEQRSWAHT